MATNWQAIAKAAIAYKDVLKVHNEVLRRRIVALESMVEAMGTLIEKDLGGLMDADDR